MNYRSYSWWPSFPQNSQPIKENRCSVLCVKASLRSTLCFDFEYQNETVWRASRVIDLRRVLSPITDRCPTPGSWLLFKTITAVLTKPKRHIYIYMYCSIQRAFPLVGGAPDVPEPLALGAQYLILYNTQKKHVPATRPAFVCATPKTSIRVEQIILTGSSSLKGLNWSETFGPKSAPPTVG